MDRAVVKEEKQLRELEKNIERQNQRFEEFLKENERKSVEARTLWVNDLMSNRFCVLTDTINKELSV